MKILNYVSLYSLSLLTGLIYATNINAATANFNVTATVLTSCSVTATDLVFGNYDATVNNNTNIISTTCTNGGTYTVDINSGSNASSTQRRMKLGATTNYLNYNLYSDTGRASAWAVSTAQTGTGLAQAMNVYGQIPAGQALISGSYSDIATVTITYNP